MNNRKFFQNAALLTGTGLVLRAAGLLMRVLPANVFNSLPNIRPFPQGDFKNNGCNFILLIDKKSKGIL